MRHRIKDKYGVSPINIIKVKDLLNNSIPLNKRIMVSCHYLSRWLFSLGLLLMLIYILSEIVKAW